VPLSYVLENIMRPVALKMKPGKDRMVVTYTGKGGRAKLYAVDVNGKNLPDPGGFKDATAAEVSAYFQKQHSAMPK
jgi:hypothetical protein